MIYTILFIIYFIILGVAIVNDKELLGIFSFGSIVLVFIVMLILSFTTPVTETTEKYKLASSAEIIALEDNISTKGSYFLGTGSSDNKEYYYFYTKSDDGNMKLNKVDALDGKVSLKYCSDNDSPRVEEYHVIYQTKLVKRPKFWTTPIYIYNKYKKYRIGEIINNDENTWSNEKITIYIPEGTIKQNYNLDLQ